MSDAQPDPAVTPDDVAALIDNLPDQPDSPIDPDTDAGDEPSDSPTDATGPSAQDEQPSTDAPGQDGQSPEDEIRGNDRESAVMEHRGGSIQPPPAPRRTGVFLDADDLRTYVGKLLRAMLGGYEADAWGNFTFVHEDARIFITVGPSPVGPQVGVFSVTNVDIDLSPELAGFLLTTNHQLGFGSFSYDPENRAVWLRHSLLGTTLDAPELQTTVAAIANTAHQANTQIADRFGGRTYADAPKATQDAQRPPTSAGPAPSTKDERSDSPNASGYL